MPAQVSPLKQAVHSILSSVTPVRLWLLLFSLCSFAIVFCVAALVTVVQHAHAVKTVGADAAPSVFAAEQIKIGLETMDASLADELLYGAGQPEAQECADDFEHARINVCKQLVTAAKNITYGRAEQAPIENIQAALGQFEMQAQAARDAHQAGKMKDALNCYRGMFQTLEEHLLPNADKLAKANADVLEATYAREKGASAMSCGLVMVIGLILIGMLLYTQIYLSIRFRRRINPPLLIAMTALSLFLQNLTSALTDSGLQLKIGKEDAYNSIVALLEACSNSYEANAAKSRWLLDKERADSHQKHFEEKVATVARFEPGHNFTETLAKAHQQFANDQKFNLPGFNGSLADELDNVRFEQEGDAALETMERFADYCATDSKMRKFESSGNHAAALKLGLGYDPKGCNFQFSRYDDALGRTLKINQEHLDKAVKQSMRDLNGLMVTSLALSFLTVVCAYVGLRARIEEYQPLSYLHKRP
jgi:hypothetical protein